MQEYRDERDDLPICTLDLVDCFGEDFLSTSISAKDVSVDATFKRIAFEKPQCGDCLISLLVGQSGEKGLEAFLPPASSESSSTTGERGVEAQAIALDGRKWSEQDFSAGVDDGEGSLRSKVRFFLPFSFALLFTDPLRTPLETGRRPHPTLLLHHRRLPRRFPLNQVRRFAPLRDPRRPLEPYLETGVRRAE